MNLDHFNVRTRKLEESIRFYGDLLGLVPGDRPAQPLNGSWLYIGAQPVLHLLEDAPASAVTGPLDHVAFACTGLASLLKRMEKAGVAHVARKIPGTAMVQVQFGPERSDDRGEFRGRTAGDAGRSGNSNLIATSSTGLSSIAGRLMCFAPTE